MDNFPEFSADVLDESTLPAPIEIGGNTEIGEDVTTPWDAFMSEPVRVGDYDQPPVESYWDQFLAEADPGHSRYEIGEDDEVGAQSGIHDEIGARSGVHAEIGNTEIGALAVRAVLQKARDNRQPAPPMVAVDVDAPPRDESDEWALADTCIGAADAAGKDQFPLLSKLMQRCGTGLKPRIVRVDTQESFDALKAESVPEFAKFRERLEDLDQRLAAHSRDPYAHERLADDVDDLTAIGATADQALAEKKVDIRLPPGFEGKVDGWADEDRNLVWGSIRVPSADGGTWWLSSAEPWDESVDEASEHAAEANVPASVVVGVLPEIGEVLGAATAIKEIVAATPSILQRPEAKGSRPFQVRIEPKHSPSLCALVLLCVECARGNAQACDEWNRLSAAAPAQVKQAMVEAVELMKKAKK